MSEPLDRLLDSLRGQRSRLPQLLRGTTRRAREKDVHRLRVLTRRLRASIRLAKGAEGALPARRAWKRLRRLGRALGDRRMWDVAFEDMKEFGIPSVPFRGRRNAATRRMRRALATLGADALGEDLKRTAKLLRRLPAAHLRTRVRRLRATTASIPAVPPRRADARHAARVRFKKARYLLEACGQPAGPAKRLQALLGREHDLHELQRLAGANAAAGAELRAARLLTDRAWAAGRRFTIAALARLERTLAG